MYNTFEKRTFDLVVLTHFTCFVILFLFLSQIGAISFVGSNQAGEYIHNRATQLGKRVQANLGAKNHATILPDADKDACLNGMLGAAFGAAGQRCMALSTAIFVGESKKWIPELAQRASDLKIGRGSEEGIDLGPVISPESKERIHTLIAAGVEDGGDLILDGRNVQVENGENGNFVGPTILKVQQKKKIFFKFFYVFF